MGHLQLVAVVLILGSIGLGSPYCDALTTICYTEYISLEQIAIRVAIPDNATAGNFNVRLSCIYPTPYTGATYTTLSGSTTNSTHWTLSVLAQGVSVWGSAKLNPAGNVTLAYAQSAAPPTQPANNASRFSIHNSHQRFSVDLKAAQIANFAELVQKATV
ncbi:uncharacterized protein B0T15DRAFT_567183 [Chaetomium strumarium]|uniref:Cellobiose dehydrogenase-like cytochrome domain-containing protein n=1 Tax=Chaetomium strumarium TaxID=1170767 RepID=A0AAJ0M139_9PEZI|nr:hypothetical protein B0T15DRAFT_567183 [Chaetomium strumarium]